MRDAEGRRHRRGLFEWIIALLALATAAVALGAPPAPTSITVTDRPGDNGTALILSWTAGESDEIAGWRYWRTRTPKELKSFLRDRRVARAAEAYAAAVEAGSNREEALAAAERSIEGFTSEPEDAWLLLGTARAEVREIVIESLARRDGDDNVLSYRFRTAAIDADEVEGPALTTAEAVTPVRQWFFFDRRWLAAIVTILCATIVTCIVIAKRGNVMKVRRIAGLAAVEEAVGRATEMGRPILYVPGINDMDNVSTIAGVTILNRVAKSVAEYDASLFVPTARSLVMTACRESVQSAYYAAGRPEAFNPETVNYITDEQFGFTAYVAGYMVRERPATCIYMGQFYAESLLLAETGNSVGSIQIAGTAETAQLPFFVAACDYTLIGEELFAASAYLSGEVVQLGSLRGQDLSKAVVVCALLLGVGLATLAMLSDDERLDGALTYVRETILKAS